MKEIELEAFTILFSLSNYRDSIYGQPNSGLISSWILASIELEHRVPKPQDGYLSLPWGHPLQFLLGTFCQKTVVRPPLVTRKVFRNHIWAITAVPATWSCPKLSSIHSSGWSTPIKSDRRESWDRRLQTFFFSIPKLSCLLPPASGLPQHNLPSVPCSQKLHIWELRDRKLILQTAHPDSLSIGLPSCLLWCLKDPFPPSLPQHSPRSPANFPH